MSTAQQTTDWYDKNAELYAAHVKDPSKSPYHAYYEKPAIYSLLPDLKGKNIISLGCGSGEDSAYLKKQGASRSVGIDISKGLIGIAKKEYPECEFIVGDMEDLLFDDAEFDVVYSSFALHYLPTYDKVFKEAYRVLKPNGIIVFSVGHPISAAMETVINTDKILDKRLGLVKDRKTKTKKIDGDYLSHESSRTNIPQFDVTSWKQPLSDTINQLVEPGFVIEKTVEPKPTKDFEKVAPEDYKLLLRIPDIIIFRAKKPK
jgi:ubiquinone/menaquinone biosynthesis C-methylase UbiE